VSTSGDGDPRAGLPSAAPPEPPAPRTAALTVGGVGAVALAAALVVFLVGGRPYGQNVGGAVLYVLGLAAALTATVLLWMTWSAEDPASGRRPPGLATTAAALLLTSASGVVSLSHIASGATQLALMGATAAVLAAAVGVRAAPR
jgi:hypothetical protein